MSAHETEKAAILRKCHLLSGLAPESLVPLAPASSIQVTKHAAEIFAKGDAVNGLRLVVSGQVRLWMAEREGRKLTPLFALPGDTFGESTS